MNRDELEAMTAGYIEAALFTADEEIVTPGSGEFDPSPYLPRVAQVSLDDAARVCREFYLANEADLSGYPAREAGRDLWYTRCGHGCGYWEADHCTDEEGERLTAAAHKLGEANVCAGDDGYLYIA